MVGGIAMKVNGHKLSLPMRIVLFVLTFGTLVASVSLKLKSLASPPFDDLLFDRAGWRSFHPCDDNEQRAKMAGDLTRHYLKAGMTKKQVTELLGRPEMQTDEPYS